MELPYLHGLGHIVLVAVAVVVDVDVFVLHLARPALQLAAFVASRALALAVVELGTPRWPHTLHTAAATLGKRWSTQVPAA